MSAAYAGSALEPVTGNVAEAGKRLAAIRTAIAEARDAAGMETQEWSRGESSLERARAWTDEAESCLRSVLALERNITESEAAIDTEISAADSDIARTKEYIRTFDADVPEELERELHEATALLEQAKSERMQEKPDILSAARSVRSAHDHADRILASARSARETAERLRASAQSAFRSAAAAISTAAEYIEDHSADIGGKAHELVAEADHVLSGAGRRVDDAAGAEDFDAAAFGNAVGEAERAEELANEAYRIARAEFLEAESRREEQRRAALLLLQQQQQQQQRRSSILSSSTSSSQNSFGSWGSGGSSFGGRSGGSFGGGGRSGGSSGGGGRSGGRF
jgi:ABC-type transporter Mla subunit MlaD